MLELDSPSSFNDQPVNLQKIRMNETGKKHTRSDSIRKHRHSMPGHETNSQSEGRHHHGKNNHRDCNQRSSSQRIRATHQFDESHQPKQGTSSTKAVSNELATGVTLLKTPHHASTKSCQQDDNNNNIHIHKKSTKKRCDKAGKNSHGSNARHQDTPSSKAAQTQSTPTRSNHHNSQDSKMLAVSTAGNSGDSIAKTIHTNHQDGMQCKVSEVVVRTHKSSSSTTKRKHKTKESKAHESKKDRTSHRKRSSTTKSDQELVVKENSESRRVEDDDDKENAHWVSMDAVACENDTNRRDHSEDVAMQSRSAAARNIDDRMECTGSLKPSDAAVADKVALVSHREKRRSSSSHQVKRKSHNEKRQDDLVEDLTVSAVKSSEPIYGIASASGPGSPITQTTPKGTATKQKHHHRKHTKRGDQKSSNHKRNSTTPTKTGKRSVMEQEHIPSHEKSDPTQCQEKAEPSKPSSSVKSLHHGHDHEVDKSKDPDRSRNSLVDHPKADHATLGIVPTTNPNHGTESIKACVQDCEVDSLLFHHSSAKQGTANDAGLCILNPIQETGNLDSKIASSHNVHESPKISHSAHVSDTQPKPTHTKQCEDHDQTSVSQGASSTCRQNYLRPDLHLSPALTYPDSGKGSLDEPQSSEKIKPRSLGMIQKFLSIPRTMGRWNQKQKSRRLLLRASKSLSYRSTTLLSLRQFEDDDFLEDDEEENPSRRSLLERARSESVVGVGEAPWFYNEASMNNDSIAPSMEMVFFVTENDNDEQPKD